MKRSVWFDAAARIVTCAEWRADSSWAIYACDAIDEVSETRKVHSTTFADWFKPSNHGFGWWADPFTTDADQEARRLALCFMHWISASEGES